MTDGPQYSIRIATDDAEIFDDVEDRVTEFVDGFTDDYTIEVSHFFPAVVIDLIFKEDARVLATALKLRCGYLDIEIR